MKAEKRKKQIRYGFTMIEVMAVLLILGLLGTLVVTKVAQNVEKTRVTMTKTNLRILHTAVSHFRMDTGRLPTDEEGLDALIERPSDVVDYPDGGYLEKSEVERDGWKREFQYELTPGAHSGFVIRSYGPDGEQDTEDDMLSTDVD